MDAKRLKPIPETGYLTAENAWRYRAILRYFYEQHERMRHYLFLEDVFAHLREYEAFHDYTEDQLQQDLDQLVRWNNLIARQETGKVRTIEEFKKRKYRYQCTPYTVEIERMVQTLEQLGDSFGGSLERTLFDRLYGSLQELVRMAADASSDSPSTEFEELHRVWEDVFGYFRQLTENATDYIAYLKSEKVEDRMMTEAFLAYKEAFTEYLRDFIISLQKTSLKIETLLTEIPSTHIQSLASHLADYQLRIPRLDETPPSKAHIVTEYGKQWESLREWFLGRNGRESDLEFLQNETNETIRRMTRFVQRLGERHHNFRSRRKDYLHLAKWFAQTDNLKEAHKISACVFGVFHTRHLLADQMETEDIYRDIWDEPPAELTVKPRVRHYREKTRPNAVEDKRKEKDEMLRRHLLEKEAEQRLMSQLITEDAIVIRNLPVVDPHVRKTLLHWIGKAMGQADGTITTETGHTIKLIKGEQREVTLRAEDGNLKMPDFTLKFVDSVAKGS